MLRTLYMICHHARPSNDAPWVGERRPYDAGRIGPLTVAGSYGLKTGRIIERIVITIIYHRQ